MFLNATYKIHARNLSCKQSEKQFCYRKFEKRSEFRVCQPSSSAHIHTYYKYSRAQAYRRTRRIVLHRSAHRDKRPKRSFLKIKHLLFLIKIEQWTFLRKLKASNFKKNPSCIFIFLTKMERLILERFRTSVKCTYSPGTPSRHLVVFTWPLLPRHSRRVEPTMEATSEAKSAALRSPLLWSAHWRKCEFLSARY